MRCWSGVWKWAKQSELLKLSATSHVLLFSLAWLISSRLQTQNRQSCWREIRRWCGCGCGCGVSHLLLRSFRKPGLFKHTESLNMLRNYRLLCVSLHMCERGVAGSVETLHILFASPKTWWELQNKNPDFTCWVFCTRVEVISRITET